MPGSSARSSCRSSSRTSGRLTNRLIGRKTDRLTYIFSLSPRQRSSFVLDSGQAARIDFGNIQLAPTLSLKDCNLFPHSNDLQALWRTMHSANTVPQFLSFYVLVQQIQFSNNTVHILKHCLFFKRYSLIV